MRHPVLVMLLVAGCAGRTPAPAAVTPAPAAPAEPDPVAAQNGRALDRVLERIDAVDRRVEDLQDQVAQLEAALARQVEAAEERAAAAPLAAPGPAPAQPPAPPPPRPRPALDPATVYAVPIAGHPYQGAQHARVTIVEAREFACPYCERVRATIAQLLLDYPGKLKVVYRDMVVHPTVATLPAQAACAAGKQGAYARMADLIYDKGFLARDLSRPMMESLALELGLNMDRFTADMDGPCVGSVDADRQELARLGVTGTPTFFINGRYFSGARPIEMFKALIDEELTRADARIRRGTRVRDYYRVWVLGKGKKSP